MKKKTKQVNVRMTEEMVEAIETERENFLNRLGADLDQSEFIRVLIRTGLEKLHKEAMEWAYDQCP